MSHFKELCHHGVLNLVVFLKLFFFFNFQKEHLTKFGFMNPFQFDGSSENAAIEKYQKAFNLNVTGK